MVATPTCDVLLHHFKNARYKIGIQSHKYYPFHMNPLTRIELGFDPG